MSPREVAVGRTGGVNRRKSVAIELQSATPSETNSRLRPAAARNAGILIIDRVRDENCIEDIPRAWILRWTGKRVIARSLDSLQRYLIIRRGIYSAASTFHFK